MRKYKNEPTYFLTVQTHIDNDTCWTVFPVGLKNISIKIDEF